MDLTTFTDAELHDLSAQIASEWERRRAATVTDATVAEVITGLQDAGKLDGPAAGTSTESAEPWADPGTDHSLMYHPGDTVTHQGRTWVSRHPHLNHWEPGATGVDGRIWADITPAPIDEETGEPQIIAWGIGQEVQPGDLRTHDGQTWRAKIDHVTHAGWPPSPATHAVWEPVT